MSVTNLHVGPDRLQVLHSRVDWCRYIVGYRYDCCAYNPGRSTLTVVVVEVTIHTWKVRAQARLPFLHVENIFQIVPFFRHLSMLWGQTSCKWYNPSQEMISQGRHHQLALAILL
jgi:hypothetical protein